MSGASLTYRPIGEFSFTSVRLTEILRNVVGGLRVDDLNFQLDPTEKYDVVLRTRKSKSTLDNKTKIRNSFMQMDICPKGATPDEPVFKT